MSDNAVNGQETQGMVSHRKEYFVIFGLLTALTIVELVVPSMKSLDQFAKGSSLTVLALAKAFLVGFYYMHLKQERAWLKFIALIPLSAFFYTFFVTLEAYYR